MCDENISENKDVTSRVFESDEHDFEIKGFRKHSHHLDINIFSPAFFNHGPHFASGASLEMLTVILEERRRSQKASETEHTHTLDKKITTDTNAKPHTAHSKHKPHNTHFHTNYTNRHMKSHTDTHIHKYVPLHKDTKYTD